MIEEVSGEEEEDICFPVSVTTVLYTADTLSSLASKYCFQCSHMIIIINK